MVGLLDGVGILDPCEKECVDVAENLTLQQREDLTLAAQVNCIVGLYFKAKTQGWGPR